MCKTKMAINAADPNSSRTSRTRPIQSSRTRPTQSSTTSSAPKLPTSSSSANNASASAPSTSSAATTSGSYTKTSSSTLSSRTSLSSLRESISQSPNIYHISEIRAATNNFLAKRYSSSSSSASCWRCTLRNTETIVFQRKFRRKIDTSQLKERLSIICRSHHTSVIKLLGVCIAGEHIYLVYEFIIGANLAECLRNPKNPNFTVLSTWTSRMQVATDLAHGLDYIHNKTGLNITLVHNHIKSSAILVTEPNFNARICHFGTAQLCGEAVNEMVKEKGKSKISEITEVSEEEEEDKNRLKRSNSGNTQFEGVRGYMSPEFQATGIASQKADVYAFGVVILELLSGEEPLKFKFDKSSGSIARTSVIETARKALDGGVGGEGRLRVWMDRRLKDSYPVDVAEKLTRLAIECADEDPDRRPKMGRVAGKISKLYLSSKIWSDRLSRVSEQISVSLAPR